MIYNRYQKLRKYVNGVPQDEYKNGVLIDTVEWETLEGCEQGWEWRQNGQTTCDEPGTVLTLKVHDSSLPEIPYPSSDGCMRTYDINVTTNTAGYIISYGTKSENTTGVFCEIKNYKALGGTWNTGLPTDVQCKDGNPYIAEIHSVSGTKRYTKHLFDVYPNQSTTCYVQTGPRYRLNEETTKACLNGDYHLSHYPITAQKTTNDSCNIDWEQLTPQWENITTGIEGRLYQYNDPDCGGTRSVPTYKWEDALMGDNAESIPFNMFVKVFMDNIVHGENGCYIQLKKYYGTSMYSSQDHYSGKFWSSPSSWTDTGETAAGNTFDCTPFESSSENRIIQWRLLDFNELVPVEGTYICDNEKTYRKWVSVSYTDDFGKTFVPLSGMEKKGDEIPDVDLCVENFYTMDVDLYTFSTYTQNVVNGIPDKMEVTYNDYPGVTQTYLNTNVVSGPTENQWSGKFHVKMYFDKANVRLSGPFGSTAYPGVNRFNSRVEGIRSDMDIASFCVTINSSWYQSNGTVYFDGWDTSVYTTTSSIENLFCSSAYPKNIDITGATSAFKTIVRNSTVLTTNCTIIDND